MSTSDDHARIVLAGILPARRDLLELAQRHLDPDHFPSTELRNLWIMVGRYADVTGAVIPKQALGDLLRQTNADVARILLYEELYDGIAATEVPDSDVRWSIQQLRELTAADRTGSILTESLEILTRGKVVDREERLGHADARHHVLQGLAQIDRDLSMQEAPEGDVRTERDDILASYAERKRQRLTGHTPQVMFGISGLDERTGGTAPGDLTLLVGYAGSGKTTLSTQLMHNCAVHQGRNVFMVTSETIREQVIRKLVARHSVEEMFGIVDGINSAELKRGTLTDTNEALFAQVVDDLTKNPNYGKIHIAQVPRGGTLGTVEAKMLRQHNAWHIDLVIIDYIALLKPDRRRADRRDELGETIRDSKVLAATFDDGRGVPVVSPWQVNRTSFENAQRAGTYSLSALSETAEAEKSADLIISMLRMDDATDPRHAELKAQILKNRDGETSHSGFMLHADYATSHVFERTAGASIEDLLSGD